MMSKEAIAHYEAALKEAFPRGATGEVFHHWNEARYLIATEALDKMAENARELGLDYELQDKDPDLIEQPAQQEPVDGATLAGIYASISILSHLVDHQRQLLVEVEDVFGRDGHYGKFEDGECPLIDRVRAQIESIVPQPAQQGENK